MPTVKLRYIGALQYADVPILGREGDDPLEEHGAGCVVRGEEFDCDKSIAGRAPKLADDGTLELDPDTGQPVDPGEGLLAQLANFELATTRPARKKTATRRGRKPTAESSPLQPSADAPTDNDKPEA